MSNYAVIDLATGIVVNSIVLNDPSDWAIPDGFLIIQSDTAGIGWSYANGIFSPPPIPSETNEALAAAARQERERLLRGIYDPGIMMALRALRMATTPEQQTYASGKVMELDIYAETLVGITEQSGFPQTINWPTVPAK